VVVGDAALRTRRISQTSHHPRGPEPMDQDANTATVEVAGHLSPVTDEITATDLPVTGAIPPELCGRYVRNGPNPLPGERSDHWFVGQGMLHGIRLRDGRAEWYRNRWVRTGKMAGRPPYRADGSRDLSVTTGNTHVIHHDGRILALHEAGLPHQITPELDTVGVCDFGGRLTTNMTAHPKRDPATGDLHIFGSSVRSPHLTYHRIDAHGVLTGTRHIEVPEATMMHDFALTEHHVLWLDLPVTFHAELVGRMMPFQWSDAHVARLGVMRHNRPDAPVRWIEIDPCYVFHVGNAHEDDRGRIVLDAVRYTPKDFTDFWTTIGPRAKTSGHEAGNGFARLYRWIVDPATGTISEQALDDRGVEFPTLDDERIGRPSRYLYAVAGTASGVTNTPAAIVKYDRTTGAVTSHELGTDTAVGEAVFVPADGRRREDDGWLMSITTRSDGSASQLLILDASSIGADPVAVVELPRGVPSGFHGSWIPDRNLTGTDTRSAA
jgi:carotenoid cleavage dioxygenase